MFTFIIFDTASQEARPAYVFDDFCDRAAAMEFARSLMSLEANYSAVEVSFDGRKLARLERSGLPEEGL